MTDTIDIGTLRAQADMLGIAYHPSLGAEKLQHRIESHLATLDAGPDSEQLPEKASVMKEVVALTESEYLDKQTQENRRNVGSLIRVRVQNMNPNKKDWPGEIVSVGSAKLGTFKKYVPFNSGEPYHIPKIIYDMLAEKKCSVFYNTEDRRGHKTRKARQINEYALEILPPLTQDEVDALAIKQAMAAGKAE